MLHLQPMWRAVSRMLLSHSLQPPVERAVPACAPVRCVKSAANGSRKKRHDTGYDALLQQARAAQSKQQRSKHAKHKHADQQGRHARSHSGPFSFGFAADPAASGSAKARGRAARRTQRAFSKAHNHESWGGWTQEASYRSHAAADLSDDEFHNLFFMRTGSSGSSHSHDRKRRRKAARQRQRTASRWGHGAWASAHVEFEGGSDDDDFSFEFEGSYEQPPHPHRQQSWAHDSNPDWKWWSDQDEREWFEQAWQQRTGKTGWQNAHQQQQQRGHQHRQQQERQQQQQQRWEGNNHSWWQHFQSKSDQQQGHTSRTTAVLEHMKVLGLQHDAVLERALLKTAFHKAAMAWHPDRHADSGAKRAAEVQFKRAQEAYESLLVHAG